MEIYQSNGYPVVNIVGNTVTQRSAETIVLTDDEKQDVAEFFQEIHDKFFTEIQHQYLLSVSNGRTVSVIINGADNGNNGDWQLWVGKTPFGKRISGSYHLEEMADALKL